MNLRHMPLVGRILYSAIFVLAGLGRFPQGAVGEAVSHGGAARFDPGANLRRNCNAGGLSVAVGYRAKLDGWLIVLFLMPVTLMMHNFWAVKNPMMAQLQQIMFMKNMSMLGGALLISYFSASPSVWMKRSQEY